MKEGNGIPMYIDKIETDEFGHPKSVVLKSKEEVSVSIYDIHVEPDNAAEEFTPEQLAEMEAYKEGKIDNLSVETKYTMGLINEAEYKLLRCVKDWADSNEVTQCQYHGIVKDS